MQSTPAMASLGPTAGSPDGDSGEISGATQHQSHQSQGHHRKNSDDDLAYALKASKEQHERHESDIAQSLEEALVRSLMDESRRSYQDAVLPDALSDAELALLLESTREYHDDLGIEEQNLTCVLEMSKKEDLDRELENSLRQALQLSLEESLSRKPHDQPHERHESDIAQSLEEALVRSLMDESRRSYQDAVLPDALSDAELALLLESTKEYSHELGIEEQNLTCVLEMSKKEDLDRELENSLRQALQLSLEESLSRKPHDQPHDHVEPSTSPNQNSKRVPPTPTVPQNGARQTSRRELSPLQRGSLADQVKDSIFALAKCLLVGYLLIFYCETFLLSVKI
ncbi:hypothetical protein PGT21_028272 [Puccinia graminis f. sp. tritici]|uniref:Uncharacterized protein n=1 Tax=Puccinia graminis f. sp. tritici TaxID=56615 RepID=A0A5B0NFH0_PUCGR|nr:hypothetical protein PGT21_028272 [Puccinia graminis f. sp. tritici]